MSKPLAYFISWTTHGSWLPGDERGWVKQGAAEIQLPNRGLEDHVAGGLVEEAVILGPEQREIVAATIREHCAIRAWTLHAVNARTNHIHVVVTAELPPEKVMDQFKAWCSRHLNDRDREIGVPRRKRWWTYHGSTKWINDEEYLRNAITYVLERQ